MKIYKITKPNDPMTVYIGKTKQTLKTRMQKHKSDAKRSVLKGLIGWYDNTCEIELIEDYIGDEKLVVVREMEVVQEYITNGYIVKNLYIGKHNLDPINNRKLINSKCHLVRNPINNAISNPDRHPDYINWVNSIYRKSRKEGLNSKEYRIKYNIPEYSGPKTKK